MLFPAYASNVARGCRPAINRLFSVKDKNLFDTFGRFHNYLRISLTEKCNLRCVYCMPEEGVSLTPNEQLMTLEERKRLISVFAALGVNKLRFTGGEPTVSKQLNELISHASNLTTPTSDRSFKSIGMTTNGLVVKDKLDALIAAGLTSINISLDTLQPAKFAQISRRDQKGHTRVLSAIYAAVGKGLPVKVNVVLMKGTNDMEIANFIEMTKEVKLDVRFIELMPFDGNEWTPDKMLTYREVIDAMRTEHSIDLRRWQSDDPHDTTKWYKAGDAYAGRVGFITSMSSNFCGTCNRLRITADGKLKVCLFGEEGLSIRDCMREGMSDDQIAVRIGEAVSRKKERLGGHGTPQGIAQSHNRPMILIGG